MTDTLTNKIKIGIAYAFAICKYGYPPSFADLDRALADIARLGVRYTELEGFTRDWNAHFATERQRYLKLFDDLGLHIYNYCIIDPQLVSPDRAIRIRAYELYDIGCENAAALGCLSVHLATYPPPLIFEQFPYELGKDYNFRLDYRARVPEGFSWEESWSLLVESCAKAAEVADRYGLDVLVEPRVGEMVANTEAMMRLLRDVDHPRLKANFDFAHLVAQKEVLSLSWDRLQDHVGGIHVADNNGCDVEHIQIGEGIVDWELILTQICQSGYDGYMGIDIFVPPDQVEQAFSEARQRLIAMAERYGLTGQIEIS
jgi:sugar phosphate isomerase/epimerase